ncbi:MAG: hypothetical protein ACO24H_08095 [Polynucleobacter sp.]
MAISYTIRSIETDQLIVDYADGSWAIVPIKASQTKEQIEQTIASFNPGIDPFDSVEDVPFSEGEQGNVKTVEEQSAEIKAVIDAQLVGYAELRANSYPSIGDQLDAAYWARNGDTSHLEAVDAEILAVKETYPKDMEPITRAEYNAIIQQASA